jgi:hypothetical protein
MLKESKKSNSTLFAKELDEKWYWVELSQTF